MPRGPDGFNLMTWNVLAASLATPQYFPYAGRALAWETRKELLKKTVLCELPDLLCLQEVRCPRRCRHAAAPSPGTFVRSNPRRRIRSTITRHGSLNGSKIGATTRGDTPPPPHALPLPLAGSLTSPV